MLNDVKFTDMLLYLRVNHPAIYCNFKINVEAVYLKKALDEAEAAFQNKHTVNHTIYHVAPEKQKMFASYMKADRYNFEDAYFVVSSDQNFGVLLLISKNGFILGRCPILGEEDVVDTIQTFQEHLTPWETMNWGYNENEIM